MAALRSKRTGTSESGTVHADSVTNGAVGRLGGWTKLKKASAVPIGAGTVACQSDGTTLLPEAWDHVASM
jgi:hypothetical protein